MTWVAFRAALLQWPPLFWQFDKFAAGNAFPISGFVAFGTGVLGVLWWLGGWVVGCAGCVGWLGWHSVPERAFSGTEYACRAQKGFLGYATRFQRHSVRKTGFCVFP